jgi:hypothetical protein
LLATTATRAMWGNCQEIRRRNYGQEKPFRCS